MTDDLLHEIATGVRDTQVQVARIEERQIVISTTVDKINGRVSDHAESIARLEERGKTDREALTEVRGIVLRWAAAVGGGIVAVSEAVRHLFDSGSHR